MKKFLLLGSAALCVMSMAANTPAVRFVNIGKKHLPEAVVKSRAAVKAASQTRIWRPAKYTEYDWEPYTSTVSTPEVKGVWEVSRTHECTYNMAGQITSDLISSDMGNNEKIVYEYDAEGRCIVSANYYQNGSSLIPLNKIEFAYDEIVKNFVIEEKYYYFNESKEWELSQIHSTGITRNSDNNVTQVKKRTYDSYDNVWRDDALIEIGYGSDGKANTVKSYEYDYDEKKLELDAEFVDIVWERTDGQLVDLEDITMGANRVKSAKAPAASNYPYAGDIYYNVEYKAEGGGYKMTATMNGSTYMWTDYTVLNEYGSYIVENYEIDYDHMDDGTYQPDGPQLEVFSEVYDAYGIMVKESEISYIDGDKANGIDYQSETIADVTYDDTYGYPLEYIKKSSHNGETPENSERVVFSDYDSYESGVTDVEASDNAPVEYFNLQGVRVDNPSNGLYIRRQGNKTTKVIVK